MQNYELLLILPGTLSEDEVDPLVEKVSKVIEDNGGTSLSVEKIEKRRLAYPIKHIRYGYFNLAYFEAEPDTVLAIQNKLLLIPELLRVLVQKHNPTIQKSRTIKFGLPMQNKDDLVTPRRNSDSRSTTTRTAPKKEEKPAQEVSEAKPVEVEKVEKAESVSAEATPDKENVNEEVAEIKSVEEKVEEVKESPSASTSAKAMADEKATEDKEAKVEKVEKPKEETKKEKVDMEDIDKKLDEILDIDLSNV
ncbi:MAG: 30S ribosomal protein S6 [Candidatus Magasanikbacteria bacterium]|jgi:small subunit ribosomal protein S6|nr:30S ribosomal protein S6 [Candidatus Magasanikbacteria bacterium]